MDQLKKIADQSFRQKEARRLQLASLPFEEKVRIVVELQKIQAPILRARGIPVKVWDLKSSKSRHDNK
jgi:hypothetical protein